MFIGEPVSAFNLALIYDSMIFIAIRNYLIIHVIHLFQTKTEGIMVCDCMVQSSVKDFEVTKATSLFIYTRDTCILRILM